MSDENNPPKKDEGGNPPVIPPVDGNTDLDSENLASPEQENMHLDIPQPFIVKVDKDEKRAIKLTEIIAMVALFFSGVAVLLNKCSYDNTTAALKLTDSTFKVNLRKDSLATLALHRKDSLDSIQRVENKIKDQFTIDFANKTFNESQRQFSLESRPLLQISSINVDTVNRQSADPAYTINYNIVNFGKFPAKILSHKITSGWGFAPTLKAEMSIQDVMSYEKLETYSASAYGNYFVSLSTPPMIIPLGQYISFTKGTMNLYLVGEVTYKSWMTDDSFKLSFIYRLHQTNKKLVTSGLKIEDKKY